MTQRIIIVDRSWKVRPLWRRVLSWVLLVSIVFGPGLLADSAAMQWAGFVLMLFVMGCIAVDEARKSETMTIAEARSVLDELESTGGRV